MPDPGGGAGRGAAGGEAPGQSGQDTNGRPLSAGSPRRKALTRFDVASALKASKGHQGEAAAALGIAQKNVHEWIQKDDQLRALYGGSTNRSQPITELGQGATLEERDGDLPAQMSEISLVDIVSKADKLMLEGGLEKLGVAKEYIDRIRNLDGLAESNGKFISASLETIHRMYFLQLVQLFGISEALQKRLAAKQGEVGYIADDEARAWFNKNYIEMVKESGNGYSLMMDGAQAMVRMMIAAGESGQPTKKRKPGFNKMLSVTPPTPAEPISSGT